MDKEIIKPEKPKGYFMVFVSHPVTPEQRKELVNKHGIDAMKGGLTRIKVCVHNIEDEEFAQFLCARMDDNTPGTTWMYAAQSEGPHIHSAESCMKCTDDITKRVALRLSETHGKEVKLDVSKKGSTEVVQMEKTNNPFVKRVDKDGNFFAN